jgi:hypothetical protein
LRDSGDAGSFLRDRPDIFGIEISTIRHVLGAISTIIKRAIGTCQIISKLITPPYASGRTHRVEIRTHS